MYHYTYKLEHIETGEFYFGSRSSNRHPSVDNYMGSMLSWKPDKTKLRKIIIRSDFENREECIDNERKLILENRDEQHNRNAHIPGVGFHTHGLGQFVDENGKVFRVHKDDELVKNGTLKPFWEGKKHTKLSIDKMVKSALNRNIDIQTEKKRRESISNTLEGMKKSETHSKNISKSKMGKNNPMYGKKQKRLICPHCEKEIAINTAHRYHFDNCKFGK